MGIGGATVYSLTLLLVRALASLASRASRILRWVVRRIVDSAAKYGGSLSGTSHALDPSSGSDRPGFSE